MDFDFKGQYVHIVINNIGTTPARDVTITFDKPLAVPDPARNPNDFEIFRAPIPMMAPGRVIRIRFGNAPELFKEDNDLPLHYRAEVKYTDLTGKKRFTDPQLILDLLPYKNTVVGADRMAEIADATKGLERILTRWGGSRDALMVRAIDQSRRAGKEARVDYWWSVRDAYSKVGLRGLPKWQINRWKYRLNL